MPDPATDALALLEAEVAAHQAVAAVMPGRVGAQFVRLVDVCAAALTQGRKLLFFGNGGSAADAQHLATEFVVRYRKDRPALAAIALTTDTSALSAIGNDLGFDRLFSRQVEALGRPGDVAIGISTSGNSPNVLLALETARAAGLTTVGLTGGTGGKMAEHADIAIVVPSPVTARIQEMHILIGHTLCDALERRLGHYSG